MAGRQSHKLFRFGQIRRVKADILAQMIIQMSSIKKAGTGILSTPNSVGQMAHFL